MILTFLTIVFDDIAIDVIMGTINHDCWAALFHSCNGCLFVCLF